MKLISKQEPVKPVAPYVWGAKYLVLDSVSKFKDVKAGEKVIAIREDSDGDFTVYTENAFAFVNPQHLQLIDPVPQAEYVPVTVDTAVVGKQYVLNACGCSVPQGETVTLAAVDTSPKTTFPFKVTKGKYVMNLRAYELEELPVETSSETVYTVELTESELQGIVIKANTFNIDQLNFMEKYHGFPVEVADKATHICDEILNLLKENKQ